MKVKRYTLKSWSCKEIKYYPDLLELRQLKGYNIGSIDTETNGLHIILNKAFCMTFTLVNLEKLDGKAYIIDLREKDRSFLNQIKSTLMQLKTLVFWNAKFDLHMLYNVGIDLTNHPNLTDAMIYARLASDAITVDKGGVDLRLKAYSTKYLDSDANKYEKELSKYKKEITLKQNAKLKEIGCQIAKTKEFLKDKLNSINDLPKETRDILLDEQYNADNYENLPWDVLKQYAIFDAIFTIENYLRDYKLVEKTEQMHVAKREEDLIPILWEMERNGFKLNKLYLKQSKYEMKNYILKRRKDLISLVGEPIKIGQHERIKQIFYDKFNIVLDKSDEDSLKSITTGVAKDIADTIIELRTLEKWYSTYICKWDEYSDKTDRIYTSFKQCGAVSGRFSCDFQQFPKEPIYKKDGSILFSPRKIVSISGGDYDQICLIDYAAEELRIQALYTILIKKPDLNLCRAFIPMECINKDNKYYLKEDTTKEWHPTDLHSLTTLTAFPNLSVDSPDFKHYRKMGKCTNFACNYGASKNTLIQQFGYSEELADKLYNAYSTSFPGVLEYREYVKNVLRYQNYVTNLFERRYYNCSWHNATNYLVQGSGADLLKIKLIELNNFIKSNNYKSRILCTIHDEIMFEMHKDEHDIVYKFKQIMEDVPNSPIPFVGEIEVTDTTWDMKKEID